METPLHSNARKQGEEVEEGSRCCDYDKERKRGKARLERRRRRGGEKGAGGTRRGGWL